MLNKEIQFFQDIISHKIQDSVRLGKSVARCLHVINEIVDKDIADDLQNKLNEIIDQF